MRRRSRDPIGRNGKALSNHRTIARIVVCDLETQKFVDGYECRFVVGSNCDLSSPSGVL